MSPLVFWMPMPNYESHTLFHRTVPLSLFLRNCAQLSTVLCWKHSYIHLAWIMCALACMPTYRYLLFQTKFLRLVPGSALEGVYGAATEIAGVLSAIISALYNPFPLHCPSEPFQIMRQRAHFYCSATVHATQ
jgi:hypothetical protein